MIKASTLEGLRVTPNVRIAKPFSFQYSLLITLKTDVFRGIKREHWGKKGYRGT